VTLLLIYDCDRLLGPGSAAPVRWLWIHGARGYAKLFKGPHAFAGDGGVPSARVMAWSTILVELLNRRSARIPARTGYSLISNQSVVALNFVNKVPGSGHSASAFRNGNLR